MPTTRSNHLPAHAAPGLQPPCLCAVFGVLHRLCLGARRCRVLGLGSCFGLLLIEVALCVSPAFNPLDELGRIGNLLSFVGTYA